MIDELSAVVFDLDGVLRHFDRDAERQLEVRHGLESGALLSAAFGDDLGRQLVIGAIDWPEFADGLAQRIGRPATDDFLAMRAVLDDEAIELLRRIRRRGQTVALLTNGTLRTDEELAEHGIVDAFDHVFNAARLGVAKPDPEIYRHVTDVLAVPMHRIGFVDDHLPNIESAAAFGWHTHHYVDLAAVAAWLAVP